jgi:hypothetical protein
LATMGSASTNGSNVSITIRRMGSVVPNWRMPRTHLLNIEYPLLMRPFLASAWPEEKEQAQKRLQRIL